VRYRDGNATGAMAGKLLRGPQEMLAGVDVANPAWTSAMLLALEDGFRLHRLIDPDSTPADSFFRAVGELQKLVGKR
jgi:hypothetical protein